MWIERERERPIFQKINKSFTAQFVIVIVTWELMSFVKIANMCGVCGMTQALLHIFITCILYGYIYIFRVCGVSGVVRIYATLKMLNLNILRLVEQICMYRVVLKLIVMVLVLMKGKLRRRMWVTACYIFIYTGYIQLILLETL